MKILIVNGHSNNYNGQKRFQEFVALIKDVTKHIYINENRSLQNKGNQWCLFLK